MKRADSETIRRAKVEAERMRFDSRATGQKLRCMITYGFSEIDLTTEKSMFWDLWVKLPFEASKEQGERFKERIQNAFQEIFLA